MNKISSRQAVISSKFSIIDLSRVRIWWKVMDGEIREGPFEVMM